MASPLLIRSPNDTLYDYGLSSAFKSAYVYDPDWALSKDADIWEVVQRDAVIKSAIDRRAKGVVRSWHIRPPDSSKNPADKTLSAIVEGALRKIEMFNDARRRASLAPIVGRTYEYMVGEMRYCALGGTDKRMWWIPKRLKHVDRRRFRWVPIRKWDKDGGVEIVETELHMFSIAKGWWMRLTPHQRAHFVQWTYQDSEDRLGYGRPLLEATYFYHWMKTWMLEKISEGVDRWANGILIGKLNSLRGASTSKTNAQLVEGMKEVLRTMRSEHIVVLEEDDDIKVVETSGTGHQIGMDTVRYLDESIERLYNGSVLPSGHSEGTGSKARSEVELSGTEAFYQSDREGLDEVLTRDLVGLFMYMNWNNLYELGLHEAEAPILDSEQEYVEDPVVSVGVMNQALDHGVDIPRSVYYKKINVPEPEPGEPVISGRSQMGMFGDPSVAGIGNAEGMNGGDEISRISWELDEIESAIGGI